MYRPHGLTTCVLSLWLSVCIFFRLWAWLQLVSLRFLQSSLFCNLWQPPAISCLLWVLFWPLPSRMSVIRWPVERESARLLKIALSFMNVNAILAGSRILWLLIKISSFSLALPPTVHSIRIARHHPPLLKKKQPRRMSQSLIFAVGLIVEVAHARIHQCSHTVVNVQRITIIFLIPLLSPATKNVQLEWIVKTWGSQCHFLHRHRRQHH